MAKGFKNTTRTYYDGDTVDIVNKSEKPGTVSIGRAAGQDSRDRGTHKYRRTASGGLNMDPTELRVSGEIRDRDSADVTKGRKPGASKLDKMAGDEANKRLNRMGRATDGFNEETGAGLTQNYAKGGAVKAPKRGPAGHGFNSTPKFGCK